MKVIKLLYEKGELTEDLKVKKKEIILDDDDDDTDDETEGRSGTRKYYKVYPPTMLESNRKDELFLHTIDMKLVKTVTNARYNLHDPQSDSHLLGLLSSSPLPLIGPIEIFSASGLVHVHVRTKWKPIRLNKDQFDLARCFHDYLFTKCLNTTNLLDYDKSAFIFMVPVHNENSLHGSIDWNMCEKILNYQARKACDSNYHLLYNLARLQASHQYLQTFHDLVLYPLVQESTGPSHYFIEEVSQQLTASTGNFFKPQISFLNLILFN